MAGLGRGKLVTASMEFNTRDDGIIEICFDFEPEYGPDQEANDHIQRGFREPNVTVCPEFIDMLKSRIKDRNRTRPFIVITGLRGRYNRRLLLDNALIDEVRGWLKDENGCLRKVNVDSEGTRKLKYGNDYLALDYESAKTVTLELLYLAEDANKSLADPRAADATD